MSLAQVTLETSPSPSELREVILLLNKANIRSPSAYAWMLLSRAYELSGDRASSIYAAAQYSYALGEKEVAKKQLKTAKELARNNPALLLKIDDLASKIK